GLPGDFIEPGRYKLRGEIPSPWRMICDVAFWSLCYVDTTSNARSTNKPEPGGAPEWLLRTLLFPRRGKSTIWQWLKQWFDAALLGLILLRLLLAFRVAARHHDKAKAQKADAPANFVPQRHTARAYRRL